MNMSLKAVLTFLFSIGKLVDDVVNQGLSVSEITDVINVVQEAPVAISDLGSALQEYLALDAAGQADLEAFISQSFNINEANVKSVIVTLLDFGVQLSSILALFKNLFGVKV